MAPDTQASGTLQSGMLLRPTLPRDLLLLLGAGEDPALADLDPWLSRLGFPRGFPDRLLLPRLDLPTMGLSLLVGEKMEVLLTALLL